MSTPIDSLSIQIETKAGASVQKIEALATALGKLRDNSKLTRVTNNLNKLSDSLDKLGGSGVPTKLNGVSNAMSNVASSTEKVGKEINATSLNIMSMLDNFQTLTFFAQQTAQAIADMISPAMEWDGIQYRFGRAFGEDAEEVYTHIERINEALGINIQEFMQYSSMYGSLLSGFGLTQDKVTTISVGLSELTYDLWASNNDVVKRYEDVATAVKSAITGEIEPIRNLGIAMTEASLQEFINTTHLAGMSIEKLSEAQKAEVRYAALVNGAMNQGIVGTYAREMNTAEGAVRSLSQSLKGLVQAFGSLFIPILQKIIPYVTAFVEVVTQAVFALAGMLGIDIQKISWDSSVSGVGGVADNAKEAASGLGDAAKQAKKLKDYTMGFDELNVIKPDTNSASGGGGGAGGGGAGGWGEGLDLDTLWDESIFAQATGKVNELKEKMLEFVEKWKGALSLLAVSVAALGAAKMWGFLGQALGWGDKFLGVMSKISKLASAGIVIAIQFMLAKSSFSNAMEEGSMWEYIKGLIFSAIGTGILYSMLGPTGLVIGLGVTAVASISAIIDSGGINNVEGAAVALTGIASAIGTFYLAWKKLLPLVLGSKVANVGSAIMTAMKGPQTIFDALKGGNAASSALTFMFPTLTKIATAFSSAATAVGSFVAGITAPMWATIAAVVAAIGSAAYFLYQNWDKVKKAFVDFFNENIAPKLEEIKGHFENIVVALGPVGDALKQAKDNVVEFISSIDLSVLKGLGKVFEVIGGVIFSVVSGVIVTAFEIVVGVIENFVQVVSGIVNVVSGVVKAVVAMWTGDFSKIEDITEQITQGIADLFKGLLGLVTDPIIDFVDGIIDWFTELWDELVGHSIVPDTIDGIVDCFLSLPTKILKPVQDFVDSVITKFKNMWNSIKSWYNSTVAPKLTVAYWKGQFDGIKSGIASKLDDAWDAVKDFFSVSKWKKKVEDVVDTIKKNFKMPSFPKIKLEVTWDKNVGSVKKAVYEALGLSGWPSLKWSAYAQGGFPSMGEMFIAREAGPELVGNIGNRTAVANNDQIVAAVSQGVYSAVRAAMGEGDNGGGQNINVYLDGKQIYASVKRTENQRGVNLMGNQLGYLY